MNNKAHRIELSGTMSELQLLWKIKDLENSQQLICNNLTIEIFSKKGEMINPDDHINEMTQQN